jgi:mercuric ion transport protein
MIAPSFTCALARASWALALMLVASPHLVGCAARATPVPAVAATTAAPVEQAVIRVEGMDCEACASHIRSALTKVGGLHELALDLKGQAVKVAYEPAAGRLSAYVAAINDLGYEASLPAQTTAASPR